MKLTLSCKEEFGKWLNNRINASWCLNYESLDDIVQNALIIEFFDSVGIWNKVFLECYDNGLGNYKEAINAAIEKANYLFNSK